MEKKIIIATSGTGGHTIPSIVLAKELIKEKLNITLIVNKDSIGEELIKKNNLNYYSLNFIGLPRSISTKLIKFAICFFISCIRIYTYLKKEKPNLIIGMGGFVSFPVILIGWLLRIPSIVHEQNSKLGLSNLLSMIFTKELLLGLPLSSNLIKKWVMKKAKFSGVPIRYKKTQLEKEECLKRFGFQFGNLTLLIFGGSQGATSINNAFLKISNQLPKDIQIIHITGKKDKEKVKTNYESSGIKNVVFDFLEDMDLAYTASDLVISRAGASTINELIYFKKPAILIPFPHSAAKHQYYNARILEKAKVATTIYEKELNDKLLGLLTHLLNKKALENMASHYINLPLPDTLDIFKETVYRYVKPLG